MHAFIDIVRKELSFIARTPALPLLLVMAPLVYPFLYNYLYVNKFETKVPVVVVDLDHSSKSREFIRAVDATETIHVVAVEHDPVQGRAGIESGIAQGGIIIDDGFERALLRNARPAIRVYVNSTRFMPAGDIGKGCTDAIAHMGHDVLVEAFAAKGISREHGERLAEPLILQSNQIANTTGSYGDFMISAILLLILQQTLFTSCAVAAAGAQRKSRIAPHETPVAIWLFGKALPYFTLYSIYAVAFFTVQYRIWRIPFNGNVAIVSSIVAVHLLTVIAIGFLAGSFCRSHLSALIIGLFSTYPVFLLSGIPWPVPCMPEFLTVVSKLLPSTHFIPAVLAAARFSAGWSDVMSRLFALFATLLATVSLLYVYSWTMFRKQSTPR